MNSPLALLKAAPGLVVAVGDSGAVTDWNDACSVLTGTTLDDARGRPVWEALGLDPASTSRLREGLESLTGAAPKVSLTLERRVGEAVCQTWAFSMARHEGNPELRAVLMGVELEGAARPPAAAPDILKDPRLFKALVDNSSDFIGIADLTGVPVYLNAAGRRLVGFAPDFDIGPTQIPEYYPADQHARVVNEIVPAVMEEGHWQGETFFRHWETGARIPVSDEHFVITDPDTGEPLGLGTITRDISELRRSKETLEASHEELTAAHAEISELLEQAKALDVLKTSFFGNVSHEFRTPLTLLLGPIETLLADPTLAEGTREQLARMHRNALRLLRLVNNLLDFSRMEAGRLDARFAPTDLGRYTAELASSFQSAFSDAGVEFSVDTGPLAEPAWVDPEKWEKVVLNLVSNALKFTREGRVDVRLRQLDDRFELTVSDTGVGIAADELPRVFERFYRAEGTGGRSFEGTGIGLALARELVRLHGGSIHAESKVGEGSHFRVTIPAGHAHLPSDHITVSPSQATPSERRAAMYVGESERWGSEGRAPSTTAVAPDDAPRVLVVDDNADMRSYVSGVLAPTYRLSIASDGLQALEAMDRMLAAGCRPDLVLSDVMMPNLDGIGLVRALRSDPRTRTVPVILLSARAGAEASIEGLDAGADDYLSKPFTAQELLARVRTHVTMAEARTELLRALENANRELEAFTACASHDLRSPLHAMLGFGELLQLRYGGVLDSKGQAFLSQILSAAQGMRELLDDLLSLSRVSSADVHRELVDLSAMAQSLLEHHRLTDPERQVDCVIEDGLLVRADPGLTRALLTNLIGNAWKFTGRRERAHIEVGRVPGHEPATFFVRDNGTGFDPDRADQVFRPFRRLHDRSEFEGTGVGLATVKRIVDRHGGEVWAEGEAGVGATLFFRLEGKPPSGLKVVAA